MKHMRQTYKLLAPAYDYAYHNKEYPSSKLRNLVAEPESLDINIIILTGILDLSSVCAVIIGPIVFVFR